MCWALSYNVFEWIGRNAEIIVAICAVCFTWYQSALSKKHYRNSVRPYITSFQLNLRSEKKYTFELRNNGLGLAVITDIVVYKDGEEFARNRQIESKTQEYFSKILPAGIRLATASFNSVYTMVAGETLDLLTIHAEIRPNDPIAATLASFNDIVVEYESLYGEKWQYSTSTNKTTKLKG